MSMKGTYRVECVDGDGVYLVMETPFGAVKPERNEVVKYVESLKLKELDVAALTGAFKNESTIVKVKLSHNTEVDKRDEDVKVEISRDGMEAKIIIERPGLGGKVLSPEALLAKIEGAGIKYGLNKRLVQALVTERVYDQKLVVAVGKKSEEGVAGYLEYKFDATPKTNKPKIKEDGKVDFKDVDNFETAYAGQTLVISHPATAGVPGKNVYGAETPPKPGKPAPRLPKGKNTSINADETELIAEVTGQIIVEGGKVEIRNVITIAEDVGPLTGNIDFAGSVIVKGSVKTGYAVRAEGYIEVYGAVEGATIDAEGDVKLYGGIQGNSLAVIRAGGDIFTRYSEQATITAAGDVVADSVLHSKVLCGGSLRLEGKKCVIAGGEITVAKSVSCKVIGSIMSGETEITAGHMPGRLDEFDKIKAELESQRANFDKAEKMAESIMKLGDIKTLPQDKKELLIKIIHSKAYYGEQISASTEKLAKISAQLGRTTGSVHVSDRIFAGAKFMIGNAIMYARDDINRCVLKNVEGKIVIQTYFEPAREGN